MVAEAPQVTSIQKREKVESVRENYSWISSNLKRIVRSCPRATHAQSSFSREQFLQVRRFARRSNVCFRTTKPMNPRTQSFGRRCFFLRTVREIRAKHQDKPRIMIFVSKYLARTRDPPRVAANRAVEIKPRPRIRFSCKKVSFEREVFF